MTAPTPSGPCEWPVYADALGTQWDGATEDQQAAATEVATWLLWGLSGRRYGVCEVTIRPGAIERVCDPIGHHLVLPGPVITVDEVVINGVELDPEGWALYGNNLLLTGGAVWPAANDLTLATTEVGTWSVTYTRGIPVPMAGQVAAGVLAREVLAGMLNTGCRLPSRVQSVAREGVDLSLLDPDTLAEAGRTGVPEVDRWLSVVNPHRLASAPRVWSPDVDPVHVAGGFG